MNKSSFHQAADKQITNGATSLLQETVLCLASYKSHARTKPPEFVACLSTLVPNHFKICKLAIKSDCGRVEVSHGMKFTATSKVVGLQMISHNDFVTLQQIGPGEYKHVFPRTCIESISCGSELKRLNEARKRPTDLDPICLVDLHVKSRVYEDTINLFVDKSAPNEFISLADSLPAQEAETGILDSVFKLFEKLSQPIFKPVLTLSKILGLKEYGFRREDIEIAYKRIQGGTGVDIYGLLMLLESLVERGIPHSTPESRAEAVKQILNQL